MASQDTQNAATPRLHCCGVRLIVLFIVAHLHCIFFTEKFFFTLFFFPAYRFNKARNHFSLRTIELVSKRCPDSTNGFYHFFNKIKSKYIYLNWLLQSLFNRSTTSNRFYILLVRKLSLARSEVQWASCKRLINNLIWTTIDDIKVSTKKICNLL